MKIFNWLYRHCYNVQSSDGVSLNQDGSSGELIKSPGPSICKAKADKEPLLEQDARAVENWELDGILTVGTLGINPLENMINQEEEEDIKSYNGYDQVDILVHGQGHGIEMHKMFAHKLRDMATKCNNEIEVFDEADVDESKKGKRVTLRDLFLADELDAKVEEEAMAADEYGEDNSDIKAMKGTRKRNLIMYSKLPAALAGKKGFSLNPKKLLPGVVDDEIGSLKKLHMFVRRMMKRKIHPDVEAKLKKKVQGKLKVDGVSARIDDHDSTNEEDAGNESVSLLA